MLYILLFMTVALSADFVHSDARMHSDTQIVKYGNGNGVQTEEKNAKVGNLWASGSL